MPAANAGIGQCEPGVDERFQSALADQRDLAILGAGRATAPGAGASRGRSPTSAHAHSRIRALERHVVVVQRRPVPRGRAFAWDVVGRWRGGGRAAARDRRRVWARRAVPRRPDDAFTSGTPSFARLVPALEVGRARIAFRGAVVPHRTATDRAQRHPVGADTWAGARILPASGVRRRLGRGRLRRRTLGWIRRSCRARLRSRWGRVSRRPDHAVAPAILALEVGRPGVALALAVVPHRAPALRAVGNGGDRVGGDGLGHARKRERRMLPT